MADTEDHVDLFARDEQLHELLIVRESPRDDLATIFAETHLQQVPDSVDGTLKHFCLHFHFPVLKIRLWWLWLS